MTKRRNFFIVVGWDTYARLDDNSSFYKLSDAVKKAKAYNKKNTEAIEAGDDYEAVIQVVYF